MTAYHKFGDQPLIHVMRAHGYSYTPLAKEIVAHTYAYAQAGRGDTTRGVTLGSRACACAQFGVLGSDDHAVRGMTRRKFSGQAVRASLVQDPAHQQRADRPHL